MTTERMPMRKIREILRLKHACGLSKRQIAIAWFCSDPEKINKLGFDTIFEITNKQLSQQSESTIKESIKRVRDDISPLFPRELRQSEPDIRNRIAQRRPAGDGSLSDDDRIRSVSTEILVLRELARVGLGVDLLIAQPRNSQKKKK